MQRRKQVIGLAMIAIGLVGALSFSVLAQTTRPRRPERRPERGPGVALIARGSVDTTIERLTTLVADNGMMVMGELHQGKSLASTGVTLQSESIFVGDPDVDAQLFSAHRGAGVVIPVRINVYESESGQTLVRYIPPSRQMSIFADSAVNRTCRALDRKLEEIVSMLASIGMDGGSPCRRLGVVDMRGFEQSEGSVSIAKRAGAVHRRSDLLSVIIPTLNEEISLPVALASVSAASDVELIVVDGGSTDRTLAIATRSGATVVESAPGRAIQMNVGATAAAGDLLLFLHADTVLMPGYDAEIRRVLADPAVAAGAFRFRIAGRRLAFRVIERGVNLRSRCLSLPYGDQALFMRRDSLEAAGGYPSLPVMEDFALVRTLRSRGAIRRARLAVETSGRRWDHDGPWRTTIRNQLAIAAFLCGVSPQRIARLLGRVQSPGLLENDGHRQPMCPGSHPSESTAEERVHADSRHREAHASPRFAGTASREE